jgi:hypothetical protein
MQSFLICFGALITIAIMLTGCAGPLSDLKCIKSENVDYIPKEIALYPILSAPVDTRDADYLQNLSDDPSRYGSTVEKYGEGVIIAPPANSQLSVTPESHMMTASLSAELSIHGFSLSQLPVQVPQIGEEEYIESIPEGSFFLTIDMLQSLNETNNLKAIIIGDVFFRNVYGRDGYHEMRITFAHLKVVDIASLEILGQIYFPYDKIGVSFNPATEKIASQLADLAGLTDRKMAEK